MGTSLTRGLRTAAITFFRRLFADANLIESAVYNQFAPGGFSEELGHTVANYVQYPITVVKTSDVVLPSSLKQGLTAIRERTYLVNWSDLPNDFDAETVTSDQLLLGNLILGDDGVWSGDVTLAIVKALKILDVVVVLETTA
jgi:hypothetical protein